MFFIWRWGVRLKLDVQGQGGEREGGGGGRGEEGGGGQGGRKGEGEGGIEKTVA